MEAFQKTNTNNGCLSPIDFTLLDYLSIYVYTHTVYDFLHIKKLNKC